MSASQFQSDANAAISRNFSQYAVRLDDTTTASVTYIGKAEIGTATSAPRWAIQKMDETGNLSITWADGNAEFDNVWDNRASLVYA